MDVIENYSSVNQLIVLFSALFFKKKSQCSTTALSLFTLADIL